MRPCLEIRIRIRNLFLGLGIYIKGYGCYIQVLGFRARYKLKGRGHELLYITHLSMTFKFVIFSAGIYLHITGSIENKVKFVKASGLLPGMYRLVCTIERTWPQASLHNAFVDDI